MNNKDLNDADFNEIHRGIAQMLKSDLRALTNAAGSAASPITDHQENAGNAAAVSLFTKTERSFSNNERQEYSASGFI